MFAPTPNPLKVGMDVPGPTIEPVAVKMVQLPEPLVMGEAVAVVLGDKPQRVWLTGFMIAGLVIGSTIIVAVALVPGQLAALVTLY